MKKTFTNLSFFLLLYYVSAYSISLSAQTLFSQLPSDMEQTSMYEITEKVVPDHAFVLESSFWGNNFLASQCPTSLISGLNFSTEISKNIYSHSLALLIFATATRGNTQPFSLEKKSISDYEPAFLTGSSMRWFVGEQIFAVDNSAFFGIEFNTFFDYRSGVIRIGDSSEKAFVILVSLVPANRFKK